MIAARIDCWRRCSLGLVAAALFSRGVGAQEARPAEVRAWLARQLPAAPITVAGDLTSCTLVRCNQTASLFANARTPIGLDVTAGLRMSDLVAQMGSRSALGSVDVGYDLGPLRMWSGATMGRTRSSNGITPDPMPGVETGAALQWRRIGMAVSASGGHVLTPGVRGQHSAAPIIRITSDSLGLHADTIYSPQPDSTGTSDNRWSSTEARVTWRQDRWWVTARAGRLASTRQASAFWAGVQAGAELSHGVSLLLGAGKSSRSMTYTGVGSAAPHISVGFGFNTAVLSHGEPRVDSSIVASAATGAVVLSDLGEGRWLLGFSATRVPGASPRSIEIACDCDGWKPRAMTRTGGRWVAEMRATTGVHHVSIRVDGGAWIAPPGLAPIDDDFAGQAGLLVVP